jgi:hypothetical protein
MNYQISTLRTPGLRLPAQSAPVDRTGARTSASGEGPGVEAAWSLGGALGSAWDWVKGHPQTVEDIGSKILSFL